MRLPSLTTLALFAVALLTLVSSGCKSEEAALPPSPTTLINGTRDRLNPFRFTLATDPASPNFNGPITVKVHVIDATGQPADGVTVQADVSMSGMDQGAQHLTLDGKGGGDYEADVKLEMGGSWDVDLTATQGDKSGKQRLSIEVGG
ncbi:MAG: FixH family protein [Candidatus Korobacteraceae bacterium]